MELIETIDLVRLIDELPIERRIVTASWVASRLLHALTTPTVKGSSTATSSRRMCLLIETVDICRSSCPISGSQNAMITLVYAQ